MKLNYSRTERRRKAIAERIIENPESKPADLVEALKILERLAAKAERRARDRAEDADWYPPDPSVDDLVSALEAKKPLPGANSDALEPAGATPEPAKAPEVAQEPEEEKARQEQALQAVQDIADGKKPLPVLEPVPPSQKCWNCDKAGQPTWDDRVLCPTHFASEAARQASQAARASLARQDPPDRDWLHEKGTDPNTTDLAVPFGKARDYEFSVRIWEQQAADDAIRQEQEAAERVRLEAAVNRRRAEWIENGGRL